MLGVDRAASWRRLALLAPPAALGALLLLLLWRLGDAAPTGAARAGGWFLGVGTAFHVLGEWLRLVVLPALQTLAAICLGIYFEGLPLLLLGVFASALTAVFLSPAGLQRCLPRGRLGGLLVGASLGMVFPVCECGQVPMARRLLLKGAPLPVALAFTLAAPVVNPVVVLSTWYAFNWDPKIAALRVGLTLAIAMAVAALISREPARALVPAVRHAQESALPGPPLRRVLVHATAEFFEMSRYFALGALLAALAQTLVPQQVLLGIGQDAVTSVLVMLLLAVILSVCSTVDAFIALGFVTTFAPGAVLAFLVFGPMVDIKSTLMFTTTYRPRTIAAMVALCATFSAATGIALNLFMG